MVTPPLRSNHAGLRVLAQIAGVLASESSLPDALRAIVTALRTGLGLARCRLWWRLPEGVGYTLVTGPGDLGRAHGTDEFVERAEVDRHARALAAFLVDTLTRRAPR